MDTKRDLFFDLAKGVSEGTITRRAAIQRGAAVGLGTASLMALGTMRVAAQDATPMSAGVATPNPNAKPGGVLRVGLQADPAELDPHKTQLTAAWHVIEHVYNTLVATNASLEPIPSLAESWDISEDGLTYTFNLRQGVKFHNGRELVAEDVKFSYERILNPDTASPAQPDLEIVESIEATDDATVTIVLKSPDSSFLAKLMGSSLAIVPSEVVEAEGDLMNTMVGTGPFKFVEYVPNSMLVVEANPDYWEEGLPYLDGIEFQIVPENTARTTALTSGTVDFIEYAPAQDMAIFESDETIRVAGDQNTNIRFLAFNVEKEPFTDVKVRKAISMVIDRAPIIDAAMFGAAQPTNIIFPATYWAGFESEIPAPDIEGAKALLAEAGYEDGFETELHSWSQYAFLNNAAVVIQEQLKQVNIESELRFEENAVYLENYFASNFDMSVTGTSAYVDPNDVIQNNFQSTSSTNASQYNNPEVDELITAGMTETDQEKRREIYIQIQEILSEDLPWIPLFIASQYEAMKTFVMDYEHYPTGSNVSLKRVWLDTQN